MNIGEINMDGWYRYPPDRACVANHAAFAAWRHDTSDCVLGKFFFAGGGHDGVELDCWMYRVFCNGWKSPDWIPDGPDLVRRIDRAVAELLARMEAAR